MSPNGLLAEVIEAVFDLHVPHHGIVLPVPHYIQFKDKPNVMLCDKAGLSSSLQALTRPNSAAMSISICMAGVTS
jgi:hypothetical protein